jgi:hypothetical protein
VFGLLGGKSTMPAEGIRVQYWCANIGAFVAAACIPSELNAAKAVHSNGRMSKPDRNMNRRESGQAMALTRSSSLTEAKAAKLSATPYGSSSVRSRTKAPQL